MENWKARQRKARGWDAQDTVTATFTVSASPEFIERLTRHLSFIQRLGAIGHSTFAAIYVDGDGSDRLRIETELPEVKEKDIKTKGTYPDQFETAG